MFTDIDKVIISTGNILSVNKKVGQRAEDEVIFELKQFPQRIQSRFHGNVFYVKLHQITRDDRTIVSELTHCMFSVESRSQ